MKNDEILLFKCKYPNSLFNFKATFFIQLLDFLYQAMKQSCVLVKTVSRRLSERHWHSCILQMCPKLVLSAGSDSVM